MHSPDPAPVCDFEDAKGACERVRPELLALADRDLTPVNVDLVAASSIALGVVPVLAAFRDRIALLGDFDLNHVDKLPDYAKATWYLHVTNFPEPESGCGLEAEVDPLRRKLLRWATPLVQSGVLSSAALQRIRRSRFLKGKAGDLVTLSALYRESWDQVRTVCQAVTEEEIERASFVGSAVFEAASRREARRAAGPTEGTRMVRRSWTLLDRAYTQCRRAITYLRYVEGDYELLIPSLRTHEGPKRGRKVKEATDDPELVNRPPDAGPSGDVGVKSRPLPAMKR